MDTELQEESMQFFYQTLLKDKVFWIVPIMIVVVAVGIMIDLLSHWKVGLPSLAIAVVLTAWRSWRVPIDDEA